MSPILVRPVREQFEHDRVIRLLQTKNRRRFDVGINPGDERTAGVGSGPQTAFPDLVLHSQERGRRLQAVIEVETGESVNHLEALAEWVQFGKLRAAFHLYVPSHMVDVARRLCQDNEIRVAEIWSYHAVGEDVRFTLVHRNRDLTAPSRPRVAPPPGRKAARRKPAAKRPSRRVKSAKRAGGAKKRAAQKRK